MSYLSKRNSEVGKTGLARELQGQAPVFMLFQPQCGFQPPSHLMF